MRCGLWITVTLCALAACGCSAKSGGAGGAPSDAGFVEPADAPTMCMQGVDGGACVLAAQGKVTDNSGNALGGLLVTMCGAACFGTQTNDAGLYFVSIAYTLDTQNYAIHVDGRPDHAVDYFRLSANEPKFITTDMHVPPLPPSTVGLPPDEAGAPTTLTVGDVTLQIPAGTVFTLDPEDGERLVQGRIVRVATVPHANAPSWASTVHASAIYAMAPSGAKASTKMAVTLNNTAGLPASSAVDIMVLGDDYFSTPPSVGLMQVQAAGHVSADGTTISTDPGEGIDEITWIGVRPKGG
jgi:hypothetical protein